jgi:thiol-disulfide isomerase/thioredoxin
LDIIPAEPAPEFKEITGWVNSQPLSVKGLKGKIVLLDCWTYTCIFCLRTIPIMKRLQEKYGKYGLQVVQAHSSEYQFATDPVNIQRAIKLYRITEPVGFDSANKTWEAFGNMYWPKHVLIDHNGLIRYEHAGYGRISDFEDAVVELLTDAGQHPTEERDANDPGDLIYETYGMHFYGVPPEICVGYSRLRRFGNNQTLKPDEANVVADAASHDINIVYLRGKWIWKREGVQFAAGGKEQRPAVIMKYNAATRVNCIMGSSDNRPAKAEIMLDGQYLTKESLGKHACLEGSTSSVNVDWPFIYNVALSEKPEMHEVEVIPKTENFVFYTFVFG